MSSIRLSTIESDNDSHSKASPIELSIGSAGMDGIPRYTSRLNSPRSSRTQSTISCHFSCASKSVWIVSKDVKLNVDGKVKHERRPKTTISKCAQSFQALAFRRFKLPILCLKLASTLSTLTHLIAPGPPHRVYPHFLPPNTWLDLKVYDLSPASERLARFTDGYCSNEYLMLRRRESVLLEAIVAISKSTRKRAESKLTAYQDVVTAPLSTERQRWDFDRSTESWLKSFRTATMLVSATKRPMLSFTHAVFRGLQEDLRTSLKQLPFSTPSVLRNGLIEAHRNLSNYYHYKMDQSPYYTWAALLDPRISYEVLKAKFNNDDNDLMLHLEASKTALNEHLRSNYALRNTNVVPVAPPAASSSSSQFASPQKDFTARYRVQQRVVLNELREYYSLPREDCTLCDPVQWWVAPSAVAVERIFSGGRDTISLRRASLKPDTIRRLMMVKQRLRFARNAVQDIPSVGAFVRGFRDAARLGSGSGTAKASKEEAEAETSAGLRIKKRKSDTDTEPASKKAKGKGKEIRGEKVKYGKLVFLTCGISNGALENPKIPSTHQLEAMRAAGLVRLTNPKKPLFIDTNWGNKEANAHVKELVADAITFLENQPYTGTPSDSLPVKKQLWMGCVKQGKSLIVAGDPLPTGVELADHCKAAASKAKIAERHWKWNASDSEDLGSDVDPVPSEDRIMTPRKPAPKKQPKIKLEPSVSSEDESDMRKAVKMRTRISTGTLKRKSLFIPGSSDGLEDPQDGPSGLTNEEIVIVSDDDDDPPLAPTLASVFATRS
ncbi:hypothetical protein B0H13DRAFT_2326912 [Mycena leptocephala]|nr:hypothetical protein B0H13DRAFT_2326912 [Mycena leptocephala]